MDWTWIILFLTVSKTTFGQETEISASVSSANCTALIGLFEFSCILPFEHNGKVHNKCAFLNDDMVLPGCPVSKNQKMWGVCNNNCYEHDLVEPILDEEIAPMLVNVVTENGDTVCGGVIISMSHILVTAHCIGNQTDLLKNGKVMTKTFNADVFLQSEHKIEKVVIHEDFNSVTLENDLAVVFLKAPIKPSTFVQVAKLILTSFDFVENQTLKFSSWQTTKDKDGKVYQQIPMQIESTQMCKRIHQAIGSGSLVGKSQVCASYMRPKKGNKKPCRDGKSGVLYLEKDNTYTLVGLLASEHQNCQPYVPSIFTQVAKYIEWIDNQTTLFKIKGCTTKMYVKSNGKMACGMYQDGKFSNNDAKLICQKKDASLPDIRSEEENNFYLQHNQGNTIWLDIKRVSIDSNGNSAFTSGGAELTFSKWGYGQPTNYYNYNRYNSYNSYNYCATLNTNGAWFEASCEDAANVICEKIISD